MSPAEDRLGALAEAVLGKLGAGEPLDAAARAELARRFEVDAADVDLCIEGALAFDAALAEPETRSLGTGRPAVPDDYELREELGRGGMGVVYRAHQRSLDRDVALKILDPGNLVFGATLQRFRREARSLARLRHPHIVSIHEVGDAGGFVYFTMDLVDGKPLSALMRRRKPLPASRTVRLVRQVCDAMVYAHGQGLVHRDLKPANVLVVEDAEGQENAFVVDFGLARDLTSVASHTATGEMLGTPGYMSPEQALGDGERIDERTDVYALGVILYECLTGRAPFAHLPLAKMLHAVVEEAPEPIVARQASVPRDLARIAHKAMAKDPGDRYATVRALDEDLARFERGEPILARGPSVWRLFRGVWRRHRQVAVLALGVALIAGAVTAHFVGADARHQAALDQARHLYASGQAEASLTLFERALGADPREHGTRAQRDYVSTLIRVAARAQLLDGNGLRSADLLARAHRLVEDIEDPYGLTGYERLCLAGFGLGDADFEVADELRGADSWSWTTPVELEVLPAAIRFAELAPAWQREPWVARQVVLDALDHFGRLPEAARAAFTERVLARPWAVPPVPSSSAAFEEALVAHVERGEATVAEVAGAILDGVAAIPRLPLVDSGRGARVAVDAPARAALVEAWRELRAAPGGEGRWRVAVGILDGAIRESLAQGAPLDGTALAPLVESFSALVGRPFDPATEPGAYDLSALRARLGAADSLDLFGRPQALAAAAAQATSDETARSLLALARLAVRDDQSRPVGLAPGLWSQLDTDQPGLIGLGAFRFVDAGIDPVGAWHAEVRGPRADWIRWASGSAASSVPDGWNEPQITLYRSVGPGRSQVVRVLASCWFGGESLLGSGTAEVRPGVPALLRRLEGPIGSSFVSDVSLGLLTDEPASVPTSWSEWQRLAVQVCERLADELADHANPAARTSARRDLDAFGPAAVALASPLARDVLRRLDEVVRAQRLDAPWLPFARLMAGDPGGLEGVDAGAAAATFQGDVHLGWLRIARANPDANVRAAAGAALADADPGLQQLLVDTEGAVFENAFPVAWSPRRIGLRWVPLLLAAALGAVAVWLRRRGRALAPALLGVAVFWLVGMVGVLGFEGRWAVEVGLATRGLAAVLGLLAVRGRGPLVGLGFLAWGVAAVFGQVDARGPHTALAAVYTVVALFVQRRVEQRAGARKQRLNARSARSAVRSAVR